MTMKLKEQMLSFTLQWQPSDDVRATVRLYTFNMMISSVIDSQVWVFGLYGFGSMLLNAVTNERGTLLLLLKRLAVTTLLNIGAGG